MEEADEAISAAEDKETISEEAMVEEAAASEEVGVEEVVISLNLQWNKKPNNHAHG